MIDAVLDVVLGRHEVATRETITEEAFVISQKYDFTVRWLVFIQVFLRHLITDFLDCVLVETLLYLRDVLGQEAFRYRSRRYDCRNMTRVCLVQDYYRSHRDDVACRCWRIVLPSEFEILNSSERFVAIKILRCDNVSCRQVASCSEHHCCRGCCHCGCSTDYRCVVLYERVDLHFLPFKNITICIRWLVRERGRL